MNVMPSEKDQLISLAWEVIKWHAANGDRIVKVDGDPIVPLAMAEDVLKRFDKYIRKQAKKGKPE